jgi:hypothetical protein
MTNSNRMERNGRTLFFVGEKGRIGDSENNPTFTCPDNAFEAELNPNHLADEAICKITSKKR